MKAVEALLPRLATKAGTGPVLPPTLAPLSMALTALGAVALIYAASSLLRLRLLPPGPCLSELVLGLILYPGLSLLFTHAHRSAAAPEQA